MSPITRQDAFKIAEQHLKAYPRPNCDGIDKVCTIPELEEFMIRRPCLYGLPTETLKRCWIAYAKRPPNYCMIASSDIVVVTQDTGDIVFCGSANDEG